MEGDTQTTNKPIVDWIYDEDREGIIAVRGVSDQFLAWTRRVIMADVPTFAITLVEMIENGTELMDEFLAHRVGLVPLRADRALYNTPQPEDCTCDFACSQCSFECQLEVFNETGRPLNVTCDDLQFSERDIGVANIFPCLLAVLPPGRKLYFKGLIQLGVMRKHAQFSPVGPVRIRKSASEEREKEELGNLGEKDGDANIAKENNVSHVRNMIRSSENLKVPFSDAREIAFRSVGSIPPKEIMSRALEVMDEILNELTLIVSAMDRGEGPDQAESGGILPELPANFELDTRSHP